MKQLQGKVALITGGAGGIGKGMALAFVKAGATVVIIDVNEDLGNKTIKELQEIEPDSVFIKADLTAHDQLAGILKDVVDQFGKLDILVNNAHASTNKPIEDITQKDMDLSFNTGFYPTFYLMQAALPYLNKTKGSIINFASGAGISGQVNQGSYAAAKEAIRAITRVAANEFGPYQINVNLISPIANSPGIQEWAKSAPTSITRCSLRFPLTA